MHKGQHAAIIELSLFEAVQVQLARNHHGHRAQRQRSEHPLVGRIRTAEGQIMTPSHTAKGSRRYRYYVSRAVLVGNAILQAEPARAVRCIPAGEIEALVVGALRTETASTSASASAGAQTESETDGQLIARRLRQVTVHPDALQLDLVGKDGEDLPEPIRIAWAATSQRRRRYLIVPPGLNRTGLRPMKVEDRARILKAIARSRRWIDDLVSARIPGTDAIAARERCSERSVRMVLPLAHLSPRIVGAIVEGRLPRGIGLRDLAELPASWAVQEQALGL